LARGGEVKLSSAGWVVSHLALTLIEYAERGATVPPDAVRALREAAVTMLQAAREMAPLEDAAQAALEWAADRVVET